MDASQELFDETDRRKLAEAALRQITDRTSRTRGDEFFRMLVKDLAAALDVRFVIVGRLVRDENGRECNQTLAVWAGDDFMANIRYPLEHTPCQNVADQTMCFHPSNICAEYPQDTLLADMQAQSYVGMPMVDTEGKTLGILVALDTRPMDENKRLLALSLLSIFSARCAAELQHQDREATLERLVQERTEALRLAQKKLVQQEKMAALGNLVAGVSHEVNTPIGVAITAASGMKEFALALKKILNGETVDRSKVLDLVARTEKAAGLVADNLDRAASLVGNFKRLAVDQSSEVVTDFILDEYVASVVAAHGPALKKAHVVCAQQIDPGLKLRLPAGLMAQVLSNLLMNSLTHGFPECQAGAIRICGTRQGETVVLDYADDGVGASPDVRARIFEPFFTTRRGQGGSGLGMHIVYNIVNSLDGDIQLLESETGLAVRITLPLQASQADAKKPLKSKT